MVVISSIFGHALAAWTLRVGLRRDAIDGFAPRDRWLWLAWLLFVAIAPDCDYVVPGLHPSQHAGLRITHALLSCQLLPALTLLWLAWRGVARPRLLWLGLQVSLAGFSHLALDLLVGVTPLPLLWPFPAPAYKLPFGILPSAGKLSLTNRYFYSNLALEFGVLAPWSYCLWRWRSPRALTWRSGLLAIALLLISGRCAIWAYGLSR